FLVANVTPTSIQYGDTILINGSVSPPRQANILVTMMLKNGTEINMTTFSTNETGEFSHIVRIMLAPDEYIIRVLCKEDFFYFGSTFNLTLRVMRASVTITLSSNSTRASSGEPVFFSGIVTTINGEPIKNMDLTILVSGETGTISVPAKTNENGTYAAIISRLSPGKYDAVSLIDDNNYYEPARSTPIKIEVLHPASRILNDILYPFVSIALIILALITSVRVIVSTAHEIRRERNYRVNRIRHKKKPY
ncbi:carboxypeptidase regulatory-like domain-containing protein, partial [Candidatus Bathyarchaeota archaeon]|nr:carboxypeptidase regulatory-like domain-containing protein [Candidatus Bathyarchaeota archaeon]